MNRLDVWWKAHRKGVVAWAGVAAQAVALEQPYLHGTALHWAQLALAAAAAAGVHRIPNEEVDSGLLE